MNRAIFIRAPMVEALRLSMRGVSLHLAINDDNLVGEWAVNVDFALPGVDYDFSCGVDFLGFSHRGTPLPANLPGSRSAYPAYPGILLVAS